MTKFIGYHECEDLPVKAGDTVTILKGTKIKSTHPSRKRFTAGRTYQIKVDHTLPGRDDVPWHGGGPIDNPSVRWPGTGGYWCEVDINDIPEAIIDPSKMNF